MIIVFVFFISIAIQPRSCCESDIVFEDHSVHNWELLIGANKGGMLFDFCQYNATSGGVRCQNFPTVASIKMIEACNCSVENKSNQTGTFNFGISCNNNSSFCPHKLTLNYQHGSVDEPSDTNEWMNIFTLAVILGIISLIALILFFVKCVKRTKRYNQLVQLKDDRPGLNDVQVVDHPEGLVVPAFDGVSWKGKNEKKPNSPANLGFFQPDLEEERKNADSAFVLVVHYGRARNSDVRDVQNLKVAFESDRNCDFRELRSPKKEDLLDILGNRRQLLKLFATNDTPSMFVLFILSHGNENGIIYTDQNEESLINLTTDEVIGCIRKLERFHDCTKLVVSSTRREALEPDDHKRHGDSKTGKNASQMTFRPGIPNLTVFCSTDERNATNANNGSSFVRTFCECLHTTEDQSLLAFCTTVQNRALRLSWFEAGKPLSQTPKIKMFGQAKPFFFSKAAETSNKENPASEFYPWKSDNGCSVRGRQAFILYETPAENQVAGMKKALKGLQFEIAEWGLRQNIFDKSTALQLAHDVGCLLICIFGKVSENEENEVCIRLGRGHEMPVAEILHGFEASDKWIGKPKIIFVVNQDVPDEDSVPSGESKCQKSVINHSGWLVLILRDEGLLQKLIEILECEDLKGTTSLQDLLSRLLITSDENAILLYSTLHYLINFPVWPRSLIKSGFKLTNGSTSEQVTYDTLLEKAEEEFCIERNALWVLSSAAGTGKSTVLREMAYSLSRREREVKILQVALDKHAWYIYNLYRRVDIDPIEFLANATCNSREDVKKWVDEKNVAVFLDGFDKVSKDIRFKVINAIRGLKEKKVPLIVATRPQELNFFQNALCAIPDTTLVEISS